MDQMQTAIMQLTAMMAELSQQQSPPRDRVRRRWGKRRREGGWDPPSNSWSFSRTSACRSF